MNSYSTSASKQSVGVLITFSDISSFILFSLGKTTILCRLSKERIPIRPTRFYNYETLAPISGVTFGVLDMGGQDRNRALWREYCYKCDGEFILL